MTATRRPVLLVFTSPNVTLDNCPNERSCNPGSKIFRQDCFKGIKGRGTLKKDRADSDKGEVTLRAADPTEQSTHG